MNKFLFLIALMCVASFTAFAQNAKNPDFSGTWSLDKSKSQLDERMANSIESMTLTVTQTDKDIKVASATKRLPPPADAGQGGGGRGMGRGFGGGDSTFTYTLDDKESQVSQEGPMGSIPVTLKAKIEEGKLKLSQVRTFSTPNGEITMTTKESWTMSQDGKSLTVKRDTESPRGTQSSEMFFTKN